MSRMLSIVTAGCLLGTPALASGDHGVMVQEAEDGTRTILITNNTGDIAWKLTVQDNGAGLVLTADDGATPTVLTPSAPTVDAASRRQQAVAEYQQARLMEVADEWQRAIGHYEQVIALLDPYDPTAELSRKRIEILSRR